MISIGRWYYKSSSISGSKGEYIDTIYFVSNKRVYMHTERLDIKPKIEKLGSYPLVELEKWIKELNYTKL